MDAETARRCAYAVCIHCQRYGAPVRDDWGTWIHRTGNHILTRWFACKSGAIWDLLGEETGA